MARGIRSVASLIDGFNAGYQTVGNVMRDVDIAKVNAEKPVTTETLQEDAGGNIVPTPKTTFLGKDYATAPDEAGVTKARQLAMAGVLEKHGDVMGGQSLRERIMNTDLAQERAGRERELFPMQKRQIELGVSTGERNERVGARAEKKAGDMDAIEADVGNWMKGRMTDANGAQRAPTPVDHVEAMQYRTAKLMAGGFADAALKSAQDAMAGQSAQIALDTQKREVALGESAAALAAGDASKLPALFNQFVPDGSRMTGASLDGKGNVVMTRTGLDGKPMPTQTIPVGQAMAALSSFKNPQALAQFAHTQFQERITEAQLAVQRGHLGLAGAAAGRAAAADRRAQEDHDAVAPERQARGEAGKLRIELAKVDETTPEGSKRADQIEAKLQALSTGQKGAKGGASPADVQWAREAVNSGLHPDMKSALEAKAKAKDKTTDAVRTDMFNKALAATGSAAAAKRETEAGMAYLYPNASGGAAPIPDGAIKKLKANPGMAEAFDAKYGKGAADKALGR